MAQAKTPGAAVQCDESAPPTAEQQPMPAAMAARPWVEKSAAQWAYERLILYIKNFEDQLDNAHEVAVGFTGGDVGVLKIEGIGYFDPDLVTFYGTDPDGTRTQFIQHVSQLSVMLRALPRDQPDAPPKRIGFRLATGLDIGEGEAGGT